MILKKGTIWYGSELGDYNMFYPAYDQKYELTMNVEVTKLAWIGYDGYKAVQVISPADYLPVKVLWIPEPA